MSKKDQKPSLYKVGDKVLDYANRECVIAAVRQDGTVDHYQVENEFSTGFYKAEHLRPLVEVAEVVEEPEVVEKTDVMPLPPPPPPLAQRPIAPAADLTPPMQ